MMNTRIFQCHIGTQRHLDILYWWLSSYLTVPLHFITPSRITSGMTMCCFRNPTVLFETCNPLYLSISSSRLRNSGSVERCEQHHKSLRAPRYLSFIVDIFATHRLLLSSRFLLADLHWMNLTTGESCIFGFSSLMKIIANVIYYS